MARDRDTRADAGQCRFEQQGFPAAYALAALDGDERGAFLEHLAGCPICRAEVAALRATVAQLPLGADPDAVAPPPELRARILAAVAAAAVSPGGGAPPALVPGAAAAPIPFLRQWRRPQSYAAAAVLLLALGLGLLGWNLTLQREVRQARVERDGARLQLNQARETLEVRNLGATGGQSASGEVLYLPNRHQAILTVHGLPALQPGQVYQVWLIQSGRPPQGAGVFLTQTTALQADMSQYQTLAITVEPGPGGSAAPTTTPILTGQLD